MALFAASTKNGYILTNSVRNGYFSTGSTKEDFFCRLNQVRRHFFFKSTKKYYIVTDSNESGYISTHANIEIHVLADLNKVVCNSIDSNKSQVKKGYVSTNLIKKVAPELTRTGIFDQLPQI